MNKKISPRKALFALETIELEEKFSYFLLYLFSFSMTYQLKLLDINNPTLDMMYIDKLNIVS
jgi:hypothetical protein